MSSNTPPRTHPTRIHAAISHCSTAYRATLRTIVVLVLIYVIACATHSLTPSEAHDLMTTIDHFVVQTHLIAPVHP